MAFNQFINPKAFEPTIASASDFGDANLITFDGTAVMCQITNLSSTSGHDIRVQLNGDPDATFTLYAGTGQNFSHGDMYLGDTKGSGVAL
jgi:hypothetical protein